MLYVIKTFLSWVCRLLSWGTKLSIVNCNPATFLWERSKEPAMEAWNSYLLTTAVTFSSFWRHVTYLRNHNYCPEGYSIHLLHFFISFECFTFDVSNIQSSPCSAWRTVGLQISFTTSPDLNNTSGILKPSSREHGCQELEQVVHLGPVFCISKWSKSQIQCVYVVK